MELTHPLNRIEFGSPENLGNVLSLSEANELLTDWVKNEKLLFHMKQVGHLMKRFAELKNYDKGQQHMWHLAGLLHDADWDQWPDEHCKKIIEELEFRKIDPRIIKAIASHGPRYFGVNPDSEMDKMLYAFDELSGFIHAYSLMRPQGYEGMEIKGVKKRLKDKSFAAQVSRDDISDASERSGISVEELIQFVIENQLRG
ncbi:putative HD superfamily hydrolase [Belliella baltica DSM 15883]|uniref:Putative HD superfamily hydrolase n=1 Tax=Belliella baltica (strain DSM 15883 / CIP 108006 / LMG 21964 / BA134) TaxID=866536 RepID=I3Z0P1_BELBD|nr:hydrolase [Belliella baltica]AFL82809.1 putative HD superfamily hydrolase [Belliella baltica DSM 15883]